MRLRNVPEAKGIIEESAFCLTEGEAVKGCWERLFPGRFPLWVEIGCGKGRFILEMAERYPNVNFVGIERYESVLYKAVNKLEAEKAAGVQRSNVLLVCEDARQLPVMFDEDGVERIYLNFSDPWPKARHEKRRLTSAEFLGRYEKVLAPDGLVWFKTDNEDLFDFSVESFRTRKGWALVDVCYDLHGAGDVAGQAGDDRQGTENVAITSVMGHTAEAGQAEDGRQNVENEEITSVTGEQAAAAGLKMDAARRAELLAEPNVMTEYEKKFSEQGHPICRLIAVRN